MEPLFCAQTPIHMTMLKTNLCVALQQETTATYCVVIYNLKDRSKSSIISILVLTVVSQYNWNTLKSLIKLKLYIFFITQYTTVILLFYVLNIFLNILSCQTQELPNLTISYVLRLKLRLHCCPCKIVLELNILFRETKKGENIPNYLRKDKQWYLIIKKT